MHTITTTILLERLHDQNDNAVWNEFDARYRPILTGVGIQLGLTVDEATETAQVTLMQFMRDYRDNKYCPENGRLNAWLIGICRHRVMDAHRLRKKLAGNRGDSIIAILPSEEQMVETWDVEQQRAIYQKAMRMMLSDGRVSSRTMKVFEMLVFRQVSVQSVAEEFGIKVPEVYRIKNRVTSRLRIIVNDLTLAY